MSINRGLTGVLGFALTALIGCGSPPPPAPTATKDIEAARSALDSARSMEKMGQIDAALANYRRAKEAIAKGKEVADGTEMNQLDNMEDEARRQINVLEIKKINIASQPEKPKVVAVANTPKSEDPEEKKKREAEAIEARRKADAAKTTAKLDETFTKGVNPGKAKEKQEDEEPAPKAETAKKKEGENGGDKEDAATADNAPKGKAIKEAKGPFPAVTEQSPEMEIVKLTIKGKYAIAYFQVYNKTENGRSIVGQSVFFKNANGQEMLPAQSVQVYPYIGFKADVADPSTQTLDGLTVGSHQITGGDAMRFAAVGTADNAAQIKSVGVIMVFNDGTKLSAAGPAGGVDLNAGGGLGTIKALKGK